MSLELLNPHSILAALSARSEDVLEVVLSASGVRDTWKEVESEARHLRVPVRTVRDVKGGRRRGRDSGGGRQGGNHALVREKPGVTLEQLFDVDEDQQPGVWLALDQIQDPHNVGAIFRTAAFFGVRGIVLTRDKSAPLSSAAYDVASGGVESVRFSFQPNLSAAIERAKLAKLWVIGTSERATENLSEVDKNLNWLAVLGNEERGLRRLTMDKCDHLCCIGSRGTIDSLNVSVAAGIVMASLVGIG